ncbi:MAG: hypothetical protein LWW85_13725 [Marinilabiliales bacterium]|nr:hypothetical protein [Marinilabiliales bacterium]
MEILSNANLLNISLVINLVAIVMLWLVPKHWGFKLLIPTVLLTALLTGYLAIEALVHGTITLKIDLGSFMGDVALTIDSLAAWFILIIDFTVFTGIYYGSGYLEGDQSSRPRHNLHLISLLLFHLSMLMVCMIQNSFAFLVAWEIMSITSALLVFYDHENQATFRAALNYFVQMHVSVTFLTVAFIWVFSRTGSFSFDSLRTVFASERNLWLFLLFFAGFGTKAGLIPFHSWLPQAHPAAPSHVSGIMSGVIVKLGIYGMLRVVTYMSNDFLLAGEIVLSVSVLTGLYGILNAAVHRDFKRLLAYCTIENIGIIGIGLGLGLTGLGLHSQLMVFLGFGGALLHVLNHSLFKSLLFFAAGSVYKQCHSKNMENLGGLIKRMPQTALFYLMASLAIAGLPPFAGFVSEFLLYKGLLTGIATGRIIHILLFVLVLAGLSIIGGLSVITFTKSFGTIFLGQPRSSRTEHVSEVTFKMLWPQWLILFVIFSISLFPQIYLSALLKIVEPLVPWMQDANVIENITSSVQQIGYVSLIFTGIAITLWIIRHYMKKGSAETYGATWGCGYIAGTSHQQYTGKSFSKPLGKIFSSIVMEKKEFDEIEVREIHPARRYYASHYRDFFELNIIQPMTKILISSVDYFRFVQNGRIQSYVLYGIVFILAMALLSLFKVVA